MKRLFHIAFSITVSTILLCGCQPQNPLDSLKQATLSKKYNDVFWANQQSQNAPLWNQAVMLCNQSTYETRPNCLVISQLVGFATMDKAGHTYRDKGYGPNDVPRP